MLSMAIAMPSRSQQQHASRMVGRRFFAVDQTVFLISLHLAWRADGAWRAVVCNYGE
jgi:hypothetical protein